MIKVQGLKKSYGTHIIFEDVNFVIGRGERIGLVGRNGHGKTTLFRLITGLDEPDEGIISVPKYYRLGHLSQHIRFTEDTVLREGCLGLAATQDRADRTYMVKAVLSGLGIGEELWGLPPAELSGGYQVRLNLAKVLVSGADLLLLDEPTNYLDILSLRWLKGFLRNWRGELMLITHDRGFMDSVTTHTMAIHRNRALKLTGPTAKVYAQIEEEEDLYERTRLNGEKKRAEAERFINRFRAQANKASVVQSRIKALEKTERLERLDNIRDLDFEFNHAPFLGKWLMEVKDLSFGFLKFGPPLIEGLSFSIGRNDRICIVGKNGKGKTTLLNLISGVIEPASGAVAHHPGLRLSYFGQTNIERLNNSMTVEEELIGAHPDRNRAAARRACGAMMFDGDRALKKISVLSGGEKSRVLLGKILLSPANLLLLDEPTNHLDMQSVESLLEAIDSFPGAVVMVTHSEMILDRVASRLIVFDGGNVSFFEGSYRDFLERVGWLDEGDPSRASAKPKDRPAGFKHANKKESRKARSAGNADKLKAVGPLKKGFPRSKRRL